MPLAVGKNAEVLLLAAGYGTRLRPLTCTVPKALVEIGGRTLLDYSLERIARAGLERVFINVFHLKGEIRRYLSTAPNWGLEIVIVEEEILLDTGGAIRNIEPMLESEFLLTLNVDALFGGDFDLGRVLKAHAENGLAPLATLVLRPDPAAEKYGELGLDTQGRVTFFLGRSFGEICNRGLVYTGVQVLSRGIFSHMPPRGTVFSITKDTHLSILGSGEVICGVIYEGYWSDVGTPERLEQARLDAGLFFGVS